MRVETLKAHAWQSRVYAWGKGEDWVRVCHWRLGRGKVSGGEMMLCWCYTEQVRAPLLVFAEKKGARDKGVGLGSCKEQSEPLC
jgi:hypothetical protein